MKPVEYLLIDDQSSRSRVFEKQVSVPDVLTFEMVDDPADLPNHDLGAFDGAIVDFHLHTSTSPSYQPLLYANPDILSAPVEIRTGLGVMLYLKQVAPETTLYGFTELSHGHAPLFLAAASEWLGAEPVNADEKPEILRKVLLDREGENVHLQPAYRRMMNATASFKELMDSCLRRNPTEAYDWLRCYRECGGSKPHTELAAVMRQKLGIKVKVDPTHTYVPMIVRWQAALAEFMEAWGEDTSGWPDIQGDVRQRTWDHQNPVLDYVKKDEYGTFFNAADVRTALTYYRSKEADRW